MHQSARSKGQGEVPFSCRVAFQWAKHTSVMRYTSLEHVGRAHTRWICQISRVLDANMVCTLKARTGTQRFPTLPLRPAEPDLPAAEPAVMSQGFA